LRNPWFLKEVTARLLWWWIFRIDYGGAIRWS
jgi:hypothetical protein